MAWRKLLKIFVPETLMIGGAFDILRNVGDFQSTNPFSNPSTQSKKKSGQLTHFVDFVYTKWQLVG